jgi:hypothetical protein
MITFMFAPSLVARETGVDIREDGFDSIDIRAARVGWIVDGTKSFAVFADVAFGFNSVDRDY